MLPVYLAYPASGRTHGCITVFGIWMSDGNQLPPAGETACPTYFAKRLIQQGGAGGFACRSNGHNQWSASKMNKSPKTVMRPKAAAGGVCDPCPAPATRCTAFHIRGASTFQYCSSQSIGFFVPLNHCA